MLFQLHNDTLNRCLDVEGVYLCKSFSPRSYIIQKVQTRFGHQPNFTLFTFSWFKAINYSLKGNNKSQKKSTTHVASGAPEMQEYPRCRMCFALKSRPGHCGWQTWIKNFFQRFQNLGLPYQLAPVKKFTKFLDKKSHWWPHLFLTSDSSTEPTCDTGLETLLGTPLESKATILVNPQVVTWESSTDLCTFYRADFSPSSQAGILTILLLWPVPKVSDFILHWFEDA